jgi:hypothetical protein
LRRVPPLLVVGPESLSISDGVGVPMGAGRNEK